MSNKNRIMQLNDRLRCISGVSSDEVNGQVVVTSGFQSLPFGVQMNALDGVRKFNSWSPDNDPYEEHDYGCFVVDGHKIMWKIDYYDLDMENGSEYPELTSLTKRVLTIMLSEEY